MSTENNVKHGLKVEELQMALKYAINRCPHTGNVLSTNESIKQIKQLIEKGFDINYRYPDQENWTILHMAAFFKKADMVKELIKLGADLNIKLENDVSILHISATKGLDNSCQLLLGKGVPVDILTKNGKTSLMNACEAGSLPCVQIFLDNKADVNLKDSTGKTCFEYADEYAKVKYDPSISNLINHILMYQDVKSVKLRPATVVKF